MRLLTAMLAFWRDPDEEDLDPEGKEEDRREEEAPLPVRNLIPEMLRAPDHNR